MLLLCMATLALAFAAPQARDKSKLELCPYCENDAALMKAAGIVSHGPLAIGAKGSAELIATLPTSQWILLETAHLRWASCLGEESVEQSDRARVEAELTRLRAVLPKVPVKPRKLDPWLRLHLFAMKGEEFYARFQTLLRVSDADFPAERSLEGPYMVAGKFLGEKDKFEVVLHLTHENHRRFTESFSGAGVFGSFRWHFKEQHKLITSVPAEDSDLRSDRLLWPHVVHNLSHLFLCAYKHFSYDPPIWIDEGLALAMEKEANPASRTLENEEGSLPDSKGPSNFEVAAKKLVASGKEQTLASLWAAKDYAALGVDGAVQVWSLTRFFLEAHPEAFAKFLGGVKGQLDAAQIPSGEDLPGLQRKLFKELWDWTPADVDQAWSVWVKARK